MEPIFYSKQYEIENVQKWREETHVNLSFPGLQKVVFKNIKLNEDGHIVF